MIPKLFSSQLRRNMVSGVAVTLVNGTVLAVAYPLYLHFLGYEQYGIWLVLATVLSFAQLGNLGIGQAVTKLVAEEHSRGDYQAVQQYVATALAILGVSGTAVLVLLLAFKATIIGLFNLSMENAGMVSWILPYIGALSVYVFLVQAVNASLAGLGRMDLANYIQTGGRAVAVGTSTILLFSGRGITSLLAGSVFSYLFIHVASWVAIRRIARVHILRIGNLDFRRVRRLLGFGTGVLGGSLLSLLMSPFNKVMLSRYAGVASVPVYEIGYQAAMQIRALLEAGFRALMPEISRLDAEGTAPARRRISCLFRRATGLTIFLGVPLFGVLALLSGPLLRVWLGAQFVESLPGVFRIMLVAALLSLVGVPAYYTLIGLGRIRSYLAASVAGAAGNVVLIVAYHAATGHLSEFSVALCFALSLVAPLACLVWRVHRLLAAQVTERTAASPAADSLSLEFEATAAHL
jgi:O-antigen/teichoic acid export membrane protein